MDCVLLGMGHFVVAIYWWFCCSCLKRTDDSRICRRRLNYSTLYFILWISGFGGTAINWALHHQDGIEKIVDQDYTVALFELLSKFPLYELTSALAIILILLLS